MAILVDPTNMDQGREVLIDVLTRKFRIYTDTITSPPNSPISRITSDGVSGQAVYSFFKEEWKNDATLIPHPFPMVAITPEQFEFIEDWEPANDVSRKLIKTAGWKEIDELDILKKEFIGVVTLGSVAEATDQIYYQQGTDSADIGARVNFDRPDAVNEPILTYEEDVAAGSPGILFTVDTITRQDGGDFTAGAIPYQVGGRVTVLSAEDLAAGNNGTFTITAVTAGTLTVTASPELTAGTSETGRLAKEFRDNLKLFLREPFDGGFGSGKTFAQSDLADIGVVTLTNQVYRFPLTNGADLKISTLDATISARSPEVTITYFQGPQRITGFNADAASTVSPNTEAEFGIIIDAMQYTAEQVYEFVQLELRQAADINDGGSPATVVAGDIADELLEFVGDSLQTLSSFNPLGGGTGVYIQNFDANDTNRLSFADNEFGTTSRRGFPFVAAGSINFNANLQNDASAEFWMFFEYTERFTNTGFSLFNAGATSPTGANRATLKSLTTDLVLELTDGDYINLQGFTDANNNGIWQLENAPATASPTTSDIVNITKVNGDTVSDEAAGASISLDKNPINSPDAIIVNSDAAFSPQPIEGLVGGASSVSFDFAYDSNNQGGREFGGSNDAAIVLRAIGLVTAQFVEATGTITRAVGLSFTLTAALERNYLNP